MFTREYKNIKAVVAVEDVLKFKWCMTIDAVICSLLFQSKNKFRSIVLLIMKVIKMNVNIIQATEKSG
jgi:hypothetical protein